MSISLAQESSLEQVLDENAAIITGKVTWGSHDISQTTIQVYKDKSLKDLYTVGVLMKEQGFYELRVEPGTYYLVAFVDENRNGKFDVGDGMGIYGITAWNDRSQEKKAVTLGPEERRENLDISVTAMMMQVRDNTQIVGASIPEVQKSKDFKLELDEIATGITGRLVWPEHSLTTGIVLAYTDLSLNFRVAQTEVDDNGNFTLNVRPGKYYLLAIIDENGTNLFDIGDEFGIYGMNKLKGAFPKPVLVEYKKMTEGVEITIVGRQEESGKIISLQDGEAVQIAPSDETAKVSGKVIWTGNPVSNSVIEVYNDQTLTRPVREIGVDEEGNFALNLPAGDYYIISSVDADGDGTYSVGDGIGGYGTKNITQNPPAKLTIAEGDSQNIEIFISSQYDSDGQLRMIMPQESEVEFEGSGISGKIIWEGQKFKEVIALISATPEFAFGSEGVDSVASDANPTSAMVVSLEVKDDGSYAYPLNAGDYYVMAIVDIDADHQAGIKDGVGVYGTNSPTTGKAEQISVFPDRITPYIDIYISAVYIDDQGGIAQINDGNRRNIRQQYGEPEDIYQFTQFGRKIEEWWYWTKGVAFTFESDGPGWNLTDSEKFEPKAQLPIDDDSNNIIADFNSGNPDASDTATNGNMTKNLETSEDNSGTSLVNAVIYYTYDDVVWGLASDGTQEPLTLGSCPTSTADGFDLSIADIDGNVRIIEGDNPNGRIVLTRSDMASEPTISPDGLYLAFVRKKGPRSYIYLKDLVKGEEMPLSFAFRHYYTPAWSANGDVIAFAASGRIEDLDQTILFSSDSRGANREKHENRNIYIFDQIEQLLNPVSVDAADDAEPAFSPTESNKLVFSRAEGSHRQLWITTIDEDGKTTHRQLTRFGGHKPTWLPDSSGLVYENNGQLWTVDVNGDEEKPLLIRGKAVFGLDPYAR